MPPAANEPAKQEKDILKLIPPPEAPPRLTSRRIGIHTSTAGGVENATERAYRLGCNAFQIFSSSPRQWKPYDLAPAQCEVMGRLRDEIRFAPSGYSRQLSHQCRGRQCSSFSANRLSLFAPRSSVASRCAPSTSCCTRDHFVARSVRRVWRAASALEEAAEGLRLVRAGLTVLIENTAGAEYSLGGSFDQVAELLERLRPVLPIAACIDTCHTHVAGYDIVSEAGYEQTMQQLEETIGLKNVPVWHCNDAKAERGSKLDRHQHIGKGSIGLEPFRRLLNDPAHRARGIHRRNSYRRAAR